MYPVNKIINGLWARILLTDVLGDQPMSSVPWVRYKVFQKPEDNIEFRQG